MSQTDSFSQNAVEANSPFESTVSIQHPKIIKIDTIYLYFIIVEIISKVSFLSAIYVPNFAATKDVLYCREGDSVYVSVAKIFPTSNPHFMKSKLLFLIIGLASTIVSCSRKDVIQPTELATPVGASQVKVVDGRLVFADQKALDQVRSELRTLALNTPSGKTLDSWEQKLGFKSLRANAAEESVNLEAKQAENQATPAYDLVSKFGFPNFIASIINPSGEYQVGDKIYWFHNNVKYQASSESELASIKQNPSLATTKFSAGLSKVNPSKDYLKGTANPQSSTTPKNPSVSTNLVTVNSDGGNAQPYTSQTFFLNGDTGSQRRTIYALRVYTEAEDGGYYTVLYLQLIYQYYANGHNAWYGAAGNSWSYDVNVQYTGNVVAKSAIDTGYGPAGYTTTTPTSGSLIANGSFSTGGLELQIGATHAPIGDSNPSNTGVQDWNVSISGYINGNATNTNPVQGYYINSSSIW